MINDNLIYKFVVFLLLSSCFIQQERPSQSSSHFTKSIKFPKELAHLDAAQIKPLQSKLFDQKEPKMISIIDANCLKCITGQLNPLDSLLGNLLDTSARIFILNLSKADTTYFRLHLKPYIKAKGQILLDFNYNFERDNDLLTNDVKMRTFLIDQNNHIIQRGNPIFDVSLMAQYSYKISTAKAYNSGIN